MDAVFLFEFYLVASFQPFHYCPKYSSAASFHPLFPFPPEHLCLTTPKIFFCRSIGAGWLDKRLKYARYADDFLIAVNGTRKECEEIKAKLTDFVRDTLKMELSQEKTLITHSNTPARFLGFDVRVRRDASVKRSGKRKMRTMNNKVELNIPLKDKVETYLLSHSIAKRDGKRLIPIHRPILLNRTDLEIVIIYNAELRGLCNYQDN